MIKDVTKIEIQFENCEVYSFDREEIGNMVLDNITRHISLCLNAVVDKKEIGSTFIAIPLEYAKRKQDGIFNDKTSLFERLGMEVGKKIRDITHIYLQYNTGQEECFTVYWHGEDDYDNPAQEVFVAEDMLCISIERKNVRRK